MILKPDQVIKKIDTLKGERKNWDTHWQELADFMLPRKNNIISSRAPGEKTNQFLLDNTALQSNVLLAGFLHGLLTNPNSQWFELTTGKRELDDRDDVRKWLQETSTRMLHLLNQSNFQTEIHELYIDLGVFGTACMTVEEDRDRIVRFSARPIQSCFIEEDHRGMINAVYREFKWSVFQIIEEFGSDVVKISDQLLKAASDRSEKKFDIIHALYPKKVDPRLSGAKPFINQYILRQDKVELRQSALSRFPFLVPRWTKTSGEKYGRSAGMNALPEAKTLNLMTETTIKGAQKVVDPPLQAPDDGFLGSIRTRPGAINFFRSATQDRITPIFNDARIDFGFQAIEESRTRIREAFFVDQLRLREGTPQMTATEVEARLEQAFRFMGPVLSRQQSELLRPLIDNVFALMDAKGLIDPAPDALKDLQGGLDVQYSSMIARSQRQGEATAILRTIEQASPFISADPSVLDWIDGNEALKTIARINNFPQRILRNKSEVEKLRKQRFEDETLARQEELNANTADNISKAVPALAQVGNLAK